MHERTRKSLCQLTFVLLCALPTLLTLSTIGVRTTAWFHDWRRHSVETQMQNRFGLRFEIENVLVLAPKAMQLDNVRITDPETNALVAQVREVLYSSDENRQALWLREPEVQASQLHHAWRLIHDRFLCQPELSAVPARVAAKDLSILSSGVRMTLTDFRSNMQPHDYANETITQFKIAGREMTSPATISITRNRRGSQPATSWKLQTGGTPIPYAVLSDYFPQLPKLGSACEFNGLINCQFNEDHWSVDLGGSHITQIEVSRVFDSLSHKLTGTAELWLGDCRIEQGLLSQLNGGIEIRRGQMGQSLMQSAQQMIGMQSLVNVSQPAYRFDMLRMHFALDAEGWRFRGACDGTNPRESHGVLAIDAGRPLAVLCTEQPIPASVPKQMMMPHYWQPLMASEQQEPVLSVLPLAQAPSVSDSSRGLIPRVRMRDH